MESKKVMLYSGGFDCTLQSFLLRPDILLYLNIGGKYSKVEIKELSRREHFGKELIVDSSLKIGRFELETLYLPFRNAYFILQALQYGDNIFLGFNEADIAPDKDAEFLDKMRSIVSHMLSSSVCTPDKQSFSINAPFHDKKKSDLVKMCVDKGLSVDFIKEIRTCYSATSKKGCGRCSPCIGKAVALLTNGISIDGLFAKNPMDIFKVHFEEEWPRFSHTGTYQDFKKIYEEMF